MLPHLHDYNVRMQQQLFQLSQLQSERVRANRPYLEFMRVPAMSAGIYVLPAGGTDRQKPHQEDEIYYVLTGRARVSLRDAAGKEQDLAIAPGDTIFVPARQEHRFHSITEELSLLVFFAPAESE
ncbi:MAG: cupin domain-containing protein [Acidobacteriales bacterium]|nr:cupin domain-containing protein [Terriglobales bacterium]